MNKATTEKSGEGEGLSVVPQFSKMLEKNIAQNRTLETLRDTLLPKLLSGEVRVVY